MRTTESPDLKAKPPLSQSEFVSEVARFGGDTGYLEQHYTRMKRTLEEFLGGKAAEGRKVLDIGAHWCHQALLWKMAGFQVTACDLSNPLDYPAAVDLCAAHGIDRVVYKSLEQPFELDSIATSSIDVVLFTEIIEHITFNPVAFWSQIYRVLKPGGRILVSTPNYYYIGRSLKSFVSRFFSGRGGGLSVQSLLGSHTTNPHWKEYSVLELKEYFALLSPDFVVQKAKLVSGLYRKPDDLDMVSGLLHDLQAQIPILRENIHLEVELSEKSKGIVIAPQWI